MDNIGGDVGVQRDCHLSSLAEALCEKIEVCRVCAKTKLNELIRKYKKIDKNKNNDAELLVGRIAKLQKLAPQIKCEMSKELKNHINEINVKTKLEKRQVMCGSSDIPEKREKENEDQEFEFPEWYNKVIQKWYDDIEKRERENQDGYAKVRNLLSKIDWNSNNWRMHISEFEKLDREVIRHALSCDKSISSLERMFLHYVELGQDFEQNALIESVSDTIGKISRSLDRAMSFVARAYELEGELEQLYKNIDYQEEMFLLKNIIKSDLIRTERNEKIQKVLDSISTVRFLLGRLPAICNHGDFIRKFDDINVKIKKITSLFKTISYGHIQDIYALNDKRNHDLKFNIAQATFDTSCVILLSSIENNTRSEDLFFRDKCQQEMIKLANSYEDLKNEVAEFKKNLAEI